MNVVIPIAADQAADASQLGEITAAWQITSEALIVIGWRQEQTPAEGTVAHPKPGAPKGRFHSVAWPFPSAGADAQHFVAALQLPIGAGVRPGETLLLVGKGDATGVLARLPARFLDTEAFGIELARLASNSTIAVTRFLIQTFSAAATRANADIRAFLFAFLERASTPDGCIEMIGAVDGQCVILQGWGASSGPDRDVMIIGDAIECHTPHLAQFVRPDMRGNASGQFMVLPAAAAQGMAKIEAVVLLDQKGLRWRPVVRERRLLSSQETVGQIRATLQTLQCDAQTREMLHASLRPRFDGRFTLYECGHPVRFAIDLAAAAKGAGTYLTGWLYDPKGLVGEILLRSTDGRFARVNDIWTRILREDVTDAFFNDPAVPRVETNQHLHGFAIHIAAIGPSTQGETIYLDVTFQDGRCGFVPLTISPADDPATQTRLLASVDLYKPSGIQIVEQQLAPFLLCLAASAATPAATVVSPVPKEWSTAIVVPLADAVMPRVTLSQFLTDPLGKDEGLVFVCGDNWTDTAIESMRASIAFYNMPSAIVRMHGCVNAMTALSAVAGVADARRLLLLAPGAVGRSRGWRRALHVALDVAGEKTCVSPTIVYEDESIRFDGTDRIEPLDHAPYVRVRRRLAGMPVNTISAIEPEPTVTISPVCCLMPREAVLGQVAPCAITTTAWMQEITLSLMLQRNGMTSIWTPAAQVYAADAPLAAFHENTSRVRQLVDGWCSRATIAS